MKKRSKQKAEKRARKAAKKADLLGHHRIRFDPANGGSREHENRASVLQGAASSTTDEQHGNELSEQIKAQWLNGDWEALARIDLESIGPEPDRDRLALVAATAHQQLGDHQQARRCARLALDWGCPAKLVARVLIAGIHNTLGKASALLQNDERMAYHFNAAISALAAGDVEQYAKARTVNELTGLGLLPGALQLVQTEVANLARKDQRPAATEDRLTIVQTQLELLHHELAIAQQRGQVFRTAPDEHRPGPEPNHEDWLSQLRKSAMSQLGQDLWVLEKTNYKRNGFFVEFGASDGVLLSNTYLLEKEFGWSGICAEPNPHLFAKLQQNRTCHVSNACIGRVTGEQVEFVLADVYGGMAKYSGADEHHLKRDAYQHIGETTVFETISLHDFLVRHEAPRCIDYVSVDTEGSEFEILAEFPFAEWDVQLITVEHNYAENRAEIRALMENHGYSCHEERWDDWYYKK